LLGFYRSRDPWSNRGRGGRAVSVILVFRPVRREGIVVDGAGSESLKSETGGGRATMADWVERWPEDRPRWGTYSVKAHQCLDLLITDLLIFDVLVFPCPNDDAEYSRWEREGWDPRLLGLRVTQLGDHAVVMPWDQTLREGWKQRWWRLPEADHEHPETAFALTVAIPLVRLIGEVDDRFGQAVLEQPRVHAAFEGHEGWTRARQERLELVASFQTSDDAGALTGSSGRATLPPAPSGFGIHLCSASPLRRRQEPGQSDRITECRGEFGFLAEEGRVPGRVDRRDDPQSGRFFPTLPQHRHRNRSRAESVQPVQPQHQESRGLGLPSLPRRWGRDGAGRA